MAISNVEGLAGAVQGRVVERGDSGYDEARALYNAMIDKHPAAVAYCADEADVSAAVQFARDRGLRIAVRGGGHNGAGLGSVDDGLIIDLSAMNNVTVDPAARMVRVQGGALLRDVDAATHEHGLAVPAGIIGTTGVGGLTLGGGVGHLSRGCGLTIDNLVAARVVLADGSIVDTDAERESDLFWAIRGGGGNFGVVTSFEFKLHPVKDIYGGPMFYELKYARDVLSFYRDYIADAPREMGAFPAFQIAPPLPFIPEKRHGDTFVLVVACWSGPVADGERALKPFHDVAPVFAEHVGAMPYPALNAAFDGLYPTGLQHYWKANFVKELSDQAIEAHVEHGTKVPAMTSTMHIYPINGACHDMASDQTAFAYRDANFATVIAGMWPDPAQNTANTRWVRDYYDATAPLSEAGGYINFMAEDDQSRIKANYKGNYQRLVDVKKKYDADNLFHVNQNIKP